MKSYFEIPVGDRQETRTIKGFFTLTKKEQLKKVFTEEVKKLMGDHETALVDNLIVPIQSVVEDTVNTLLKEVTIRTNL